jgi:hypothetical protein
VDAEKETRETRRRETSGQEPDEQEYQSRVHGVEQDVGREERLGGERLRRVRHERPHGERVIVVRDHQGSQGAVVVTQDPGVLLNVIGIVPVHERVVEGAKIGPERHHHDRDQDGGDRRPGQ